VRAIMRADGKRLAHVEKLMETLTMPPVVTPSAGGWARAVWWSLLATGACALAVVALGSAHLRASPRASRYRTETVTRGPVTGVLRLPAWLEPTATVRVGSDNTGRVMTVSARVGQHVRRGQVLARLDDRALRAEVAGAVAQAEASRVAVRQAQVKLRQIIYLLQRGDDEDRRGELESAALDAEGELYGAVAAQKRQDADAARTRARVGGSLLRAPLDGVVVSRSVEPGETVTPGAPLFVIAADASALRVVGHVGEADVAHVRRGAALFTTRALPGRVFPAMVTTVGPVPDGDRPPFSYRVQLLARNDEHLLRAGMTVTLSLPIESAADALRVPVTAVRRNADGHTSIQVLDTDGRPARVPVEAGVSDGRVTEILAADVAPGALVIADPR
jgi:HlyD family secretion protein